MTRDDYQKKKKKKKLSRNIQLLDIKFEYLFGYSEAESYRTKIDRLAHLTVFYDEIFTFDLHMPNISNVTFLVFSLTFDDENAEFS